METETISYEEKEQQLVNDCVKELREYCTQGSHTVRDKTKKGVFMDQTHLCPCVILPGNSNLQISSLSEELAKKTDDASRQQEEITHLLSQIVDLQKKAKLVLKQDPHHTNTVINLCRTCPLMSG